MTSQSSRPPPARLAGSLASAMPGESRQVVSADEPLAAELAREGILPGTILAVISRTPLGGPLVVEAGRARLAISADVAARIRVARR
jgi:Fe2+ transport system protein FeoA